MPGISGQALMNGTFPRASTVPLDSRLGLLPLIADKPLQLEPYMPTWYPPRVDTNIHTVVTTTPTNNSSQSRHGPGPGGANVAIPHPPIPIPNPWTVAVDATKLLSGAAGALIAIVLSIPGASSIKDKNGPDVYLYSNPPWYDTGTLSTQAVLSVKGDGRIVSLPGLSIGMFFEGHKVSSNSTNSHQEKYAYVQCGYLPDERTVIKFQWTSRASASVWVSKPGSLNVHRQLPDRSEASWYKMKPWPGH